MQIVLPFTLAAVLVWGPRLVWWVIRQLRNRRPRPPRWWTVGGTGPRKDEDE